MNKKPWKGQPKATLQPPKDEGEDPREQPTPKHAKGGPYRGATLSSSVVRSPGARLGPSRAFCEDMKARGSVPLRFDKKKKKKKKKKRGPSPFPLKKSSTFPSRDDGPSLSRELLGTIPIPPLPSSTVV